MFSVETLQILQRIDIFTIFVNLITPRMSITPLFHIEEHFLFLLLFFLHYLSFQCFDSLSCALNLTSTFLLFNEKFTLETLQILQRIDIFTIFVNLITPRMSFYFNAAICLIKFMYVPTMIFLLLFFIYII
jgi:hypothetical protein